MKTYKEFIKLFEVTRLRSDWRKEFESAFSLRDEKSQIAKINFLMKEMRKDVLPKNLIQYTEYKVKEWFETPDKRKIIQSTILNHLK